MKWPSHITRSLIRLDRNRHGGGVAIYVHSSIVLLVGPAGLELIVVSLTRNNFKLCLCVFYRPLLLLVQKFLILCVKLCLVLTFLTFLTFYYLVILM